MRIPLGARYAARFVFKRIKFNPDKNRASKNNYNWYNEIENKHKDVYIDVDKGHVELTHSGVIHGE